MNRNHFKSQITLAASLLLAALLAGNTLMAKTSSLATTGEVQKTDGKQLTLQISNPSKTDRVTETVEFPLAEITQKLQLSEEDSFIILGKDGKEQLYQITSDRTVIFPVTMKASETLKFIVRAGVRPASAAVISFGKIYPARFDDLAWENDKVAFRAYGPALQERGDKAFGYDLFAKRGSSSPVLVDMYRMETDKALKARIKYLRENGHKEEGDSLQRKKSYHIDKGYGMDCYAVGATLGAGAAAQVDQGEIIYPWCWKECEFLDNGPFRFKVRLTFTPMKVGAKANVVETRIITLDAGSHLNKTEITYSGITEPMPVVTGIVIHDEKNPSATAAGKGYISYQDPTTGKDNGELYIGHAYAEELEDAKVALFPETGEKGPKTPKGHVLACSTYVPGTPFTYWWGFGWNRADISSYEAWNAYLENFTAQLRQPLKIRIK